MKELVTMWRYSMMVAITVLCAGIYMLFLLPTKSIALIPGITEIRPASLLPVIFGLLFGPAGAWGSAIGNLGGDLFGTLTPGSIFGFAGNFLYAYIPYKLWYCIKQRHGEDMTPAINSPLETGQVRHRSLHLKHSMCRHHRMGAESAETGKLRSTGHHNNTQQHSHHFAVRSCPASDIVQNGK